MNIRSIFLLILVLTFHGCSPAPDRIDWVEMDEALMQQQGTGQPILFYFYSQGNLYCELMHRSTFADPAIADVVNRNYIPVRVQLTQKASPDLPSGKRLAEAFQISSVPALVVVDAEHRPVDTRVGFLTARTTREFLEDNIDPLSLPAETGIPVP